MTRIINPKTVGDIARLQAEMRPDKTALVFEGNRTNYADLDTYANRAANALLEAGLRKNQRVCYIGKNTDTYFEILLGLSKAGGVLCPLNWRLAEPEIIYIIKDTLAGILFLGPEFMDLEPALRAAIPNLTLIPLSNYAQWRDTGKDNDPRVPTAPEDDVLQLYTSGTTGHPKGVRMSNRSLLSTRARDLSAQAPIWNQWSSEDVGLVAMPCFHIGGTGFGLTILYAGASGVIMPQFNAHEILDIMNTHKITKQFIVPSALKIILDNPACAQTDFSHLKYIQYGASPIPLDLMQRCIDTFGCGFVQKYGMTETCGTCVALGPEDHTLPPNPKMGSVGKPLIGVQLKIIDDHNRGLPAGETGEIAILSQSNMSGYWNNPDATQKTFTEDGWLKTGDAGYLDVDGYLFIQDRIKDMIISGGENIYPAEVENALCTHPAIEDVAVIGVPDKKWGEAVKAILVFKDGETLTEDAVIAYTKSRIAGYKCPKSISIISELPRNASGKVLKRELRAPYWADQERAVN